jgi:hypothetical protein
MQMAAFLSTRVLDKEREARGARMGTTRARARARRETAHRAQVRTRRGETAR